MTLIETGGLMFFAGMMLAWRYYDGNTWHISTMEFLAISLCVGGTAAIIVGSIARMVEQWILRH
jgi:hypothetical protein